MPSVARSLALTTTVSIVGLAASLIVTASAPRVLEANDLALFFVVTSALGVAGQVGTLSLPEVVMRQAAQPAGRAGQVERGGVVVACVRSLAIAGLLAALATYDALGAAAFILLAWVPLAGLSRLTAVVVRLQGSDVLGSSVGEVARRLGMAVGLMMVWRLGGGWQGVAIAGLVGELVFLAVGSRAVSPPLNLAGWRLQPLASTVETWRLGSRHALAGLPRLIIATAGPLVLTMRLGDGGAAEVTELGMAIRLTAVGGLLTVTCTRALAAWTVRAAVDDTTRLEHRRRIQRWSLVLMMLSLVPGVLAIRPEFTTLVFGEQGRLISAWTALATGVSVGFISGGALRYQELIVNLGPDRIWPASVAVVSTWTGLATALAGPFGADGVAVASAVCSLAFFSVLVVTGRRHLPATPLRPEPSPSR